MPTVREIDFVPIGIAHEVRHGCSAARKKDADIGARQHLQWRRLRRADIRSGEVCAGERTGPERTLDTHPCRWRVCPVQMRYGSGKALAAVLFLAQALGDPDMGLARSDAFFHEIHRRPPHILSFMTRV